MKTAKTPYEIRSELLTLAYQILHERYTTEALVEHQRIERDLNDGLQPKEYMTLPFQGSTKSPTTEEIIEEARKLNEFVSRGS